MSTQPADEFRDNLRRELLEDLLLAAINVALLLVCDFSSVSLIFAIGSAGPSAFSALLTPVVKGIDANLGRILRVATATCQFLTILWCLLLSLCRYLSCCKEKKTSLFHKDVCTTGAHGDPIVLPSVVLLGLFLTTVLPRVFSKNWSGPVTLTLLHAVVGVWAWFLEGAVLRLTFLIWAACGVLYWLSYNTLMARLGLRLINSAAILVDTAFFALLTVLLGRPSLRDERMKQDDFTVPFLYGVSITVLFLVLKRSQSKQTKISVFLLALATTPKSLIPVVHSSLSDDILEQFIKSLFFTANTMVVLTDRTPKIEFVFFLVFAVALDVATGFYFLLATDDYVKEETRAFQISLDIISLLILLVERTLSSLNVLL